MSFKIFCFVLIYHLYAVQAKPGEKFERILYGEKAHIEDFPYFAGLVNCGAAIISETHLITAAHCFDDVSVRYLIKYAFVGGETQYNSQIIFYKEVIIHPDYVQCNKMPFNDIAIIVLAAPLKFSKTVQSLRLPQQMGSRKASMTFVGRGRDETGQTSTDLKWMEVEGLTVEECMSLIPPIYQFIYHQYLDTLVKMNICARRPEDKPGICNGDSGSPLANDGVLVGLASFGGSDCETNRLGFYVNVAYFVDWVKHVTGLD